MIAIINTVDEFLNSPEIDAVNWESKPGAGRWSAKEIIGHLTDSAQINLQRFVRCTHEQNFKLIYSQDEWVAAQHYQQANVNDLLQLWRSLNIQLQRVLDNYPADRWEATCDTGKTAVNLNTVAFLADDYVAHMQHHLKSIISY